MHLSDVGLASKASLGTPRSPLRFEEFSGDAFSPGSGRAPARPAHCVSSATIAFAKSQTLTIAEMDRLEAAGALHVDTQAQGCSSATPLESESPSGSPVAAADKASCQWYSKASQSPAVRDSPTVSQSPALDESPAVDQSPAMGQSPTLEESQTPDESQAQGEGYSEYNDFASESDGAEPESTGLAGCHRASFGQLSRLLGARCQSDSSVQSEGAETAAGEARESDLSQLKSNLATRLSLNMTACSAQIWTVFAQLADLLAAHVAAAAKDLAIKAAREMKERFHGLLHVKELPMREVEARVGAAREREA